MQEAPKITPALLIKRKMRKRWGDVEMMLLLEIGVKPMTFAELVDATGVSTSGVWNMLTKNILNKDLGERFQQGGKTYYKLSTLGQQELYGVLKG